MAGRELADLGIVELVADKHGRRQRAPLDLDRAERERFQRFGFGAAGSGKFAMKAGGRLRPVAASEAGTGPPVGGGQDLGRVLKGQRQVMGGRSGGFAQLLGQPESEELADKFWAGRRRAWQRPGRECL